MGERESRTQSLPQYASILTAELHALRLVANMAKISSRNRIVIFTDSGSAIQSLQDKYISNPLARKLQYQIDEIITRKTIVICWVPAHVGIKENETADRLAKAAAKGREQAAQLFYRDYYYEIKKRMYSCWTEEWQTRMKYLRKIMDPSATIQCPSGNRREQVVVNRLRLLHSLLSHGHLMNNQVQEPLRACPL